MGRVIGFRDFPQAWDGPVVFEFNLFSDHTKTVRYKARLEKHIFDIYVPKFMLPENDPMPEKIVIAVGKAIGPVQTIGFQGEPKKPRVCSEICEYTLYEEMGNSIKYKLVCDQGKYFLYLPYEVFAGEPPPNRVFLQVAIPQS